MLALLLLSYLLYSVHCTVYTVQCTVYKCSERQRKGQWVIGLFRLGCTFVRPVPPWFRGIFDSDSVLGSIVLFFVISK
jgi:hypothetical protein